MRGKINLSRLDRVSYTTNEENKKDSEYQHRDIYNKILKYLKTRNFIVSVDPKIKKHYACLSKDRRLARHKKYDLIMLLHVFPNGFEIDIDYKKNRMDGVATGIWGDYNEQYNKLSYMELKVRENESVKLCEFIEKTGDIDISFNYKKRSPEENIIYDFQQRSFSRNKIKSLDEIAGFLEDYDHGYNSHDKNKNKISCGELKYFYDYNGYLNRGIAYHHINNMWWVITNEDYFNKACFELFDYCPRMLIRKSQTKEDQVYKLKDLLKKSESKKDYEKCIKIRDKINFLEAA